MTHHSFLSGMSHLQSDWRRKCRAILRLHEVPCEAGDCHEASKALAGHLRAVGWAAVKKTGFLHAAKKRHYRQVAHKKYQSRQLAPLLTSVLQSHVGGMSHSWVEVKTERGLLLVDPTMGQLATEVDSQAAVPAMGAYVVSPPNCARPLKSSSIHLSCRQVNLPTHHCFYLQTKNTSSLYWEKQRLCDN